MLASGIADFLLAAIIVMSWPVSAAWALRLIAEINLITSGSTLVTTAIGGRSVTEASSRIGLAGRDAISEVRGQKE